ncbi:MAG: DUF3298 domain-containing protein [Patescibacteria group bacterium]|nr:DUF3298 domain-containing protein [Patescibacteria group bacterium]
MKNRHVLALLALGTTALVAVGLFMLWKFSGIISEGQTTIVSTPPPATGPVGEQLQTAGTEPDEPTEAATNTQQALKVGPANAVAELIKKKSIKENTRFYDLEANYPQLSGYADTAAQQLFNDKMSYDATTSVTAFIEYFSDPDADFSQAPGRGFLEETYSIEPFGQLLNILIEGGEYTGGAHPFTVYRSYVFDVERNIFLELEDLFKPHTEYLKIISEYSIAELNKRDVSDTSWISNGAGMDVKNFQFFRLTREGLNILFPPYQVASYAEGPQEVVIPFTLIEDILADEYAE